MARGNQFRTFGEGEARPADPEVRRTNFRRVAALFRPYRARLAAVLGLIVVSAAVAMISPFLLRAILDTALPERDNGLLSALVGGMIAIAVLTGVIGVFQTLMSNQVGQRVMHDLRSNVYRHLQRLSFAFFTRTRTGEVAVAHQQRHRGRAERCDEHDHVDCRQRHDRARDRRGDVHS